MIKRVIGFSAILAVLMVLGFKLTAQKTGDVDLVVFSYDRPLQLYAFLESATKYLKGVETTTVIYRVTDKDYARGYEQVKAQFPSVSFIQQSSNPYQDFKPLLLKASFESPTSHIVYGVDDIVVTDHVDMHQVVAALEKADAYGFFLRLGIHVTECYMANKPQRVPPLQKVSEDIYSWTFNQGDGDWAYPNSQDMTVYRKKDLKDLYQHMNFVSPNSCEGQWSAYADLTKKGLCFSTAKIVNIPMNLVQSIYVTNRNMNLFTPKELLAKFNEGLKMDIEPLYQAKFNSVHVEYVPSFVKRA